MDIIRKIIADGTAEEEFFKQVEKRSGETDKKVTAIVSEIIENVLTPRNSTASCRNIMKFPATLSTTRSPKPTPHSPTLF